MSVGPPRTPSAVHGRERRVTRVPFTVGRAGAIIGAMGRLVTATAPVAALAALVALAAAPACHLADTPDAISCPAGSHADTGKCVLDSTASTVIVIGLDDAGACIVSPGIVTVASTADFQFRNDDNVEHVVMGTDGQSWAKVPAHQPSAFINISKVGRWDYDVSGCSQGGSVSVEK